MLLFKWSFKLGDLLKCVKDCRANPNGKYKDISKILGKIAKMNQHAMNGSSNTGRKRVIKLATSEDSLKKVHFCYFNMKLVWRYQSSSFLDAKLFECLESMVAINGTIFEGSTIAELHDQPEIIVQNSISFNGFHY